ncbi:MAG: hypothetical protein ABIE55_00665 [Candidatus Aenigmatarchaeota archaeon]
MVEFFIETAIDKLIKLLRKRKRIRISEAAKILKVTQKQLDEWVFTLEDKGIVDLKYPVFGEPEVVIKELTSEEVEAENVKDIEIDTRIIPGKPIKQRMMPKLKHSKIPEESVGQYEETEEIGSPEYADIVNELKSLQDRISRMASKRSEEAKPSSMYVNEKLKFLEGKLHQLSSKTEKEEKLYETEKVILEKIEAIEKRLEKKSKKKKQKKRGK